MFHVELPEGFERRLEIFHQELMEWNPSAGLLSSKLTKGMLIEHSQDSLALLPYLVGAGNTHMPHFDIGSGGGYPAVPLALALPAHEITCVERNTRKAAFLIRIGKLLDISNLRVERADFPNIPLPDLCTITARAIEHPKEFANVLQERWKPGWVFLSQLANTKEYFRAPLEVREIADGLTTFRRGSLYLVQQPESSTWNRSG